MTITKILLEIYIDDIEFKTKQLKNMTAHK